MSMKHNSSKNRLNYIKFLAAIAFSGDKGAAESEFSAACRITPWNSLVVTWYCSECRLNNAAFPTAAGALARQAIKVPPPLLCTRPARCSRPRYANLRHHANAAEPTPACEGAAEACLARVVFERYYREPLNFLALQLRNRDAAADLAQEGFARVYAAERAGTAIRNPRALL